MSKLVLPTTSSPAHHPLHQSNPPMAEEQDWRSFMEHMRSHMTQISTDIVEIKSDIGVMKSDIAVMKDNMKGLTEKVKDVHNLMHPSAGTYPSTPLDLT